MVRVWLRPALAALRQQAAKNVSVHASARQALLAQQHFIAVRQFASKKDKGYEKKSIHDKIEEVDDDLTVLPPDVEFLAKDKSLEPELMRAMLEEEFGDMEIGDDDDDDDDDTGDYNDDEDDPEDIDDLSEDELAQLEKLLAEREDSDEEDFLNEDGAELTDAEWASKYERDLAGMNTGSTKDEVVDDRLFIEMPHFDPSMNMASDEMYDSGDEEDEGDDDEEYDEDDDDDDDDSDDEDDNTPDPFEQWDQSALYTPEMLNWMLPADKRQPFTKNKDKPWKYFVRANHPDPVELALDVDLLRLFISPTGRIRPRRYTGLTAKQQRQLARSVKISRQMGLLPYLSRYPEPSPEQWRAMEDDIIAKHLAEVEKNGDTVVDDDDDDDDDAEFAGMDDE